MRNAEVEKRVWWNPGVKTETYSSFRSNESSFEMLKIRKIRIEVLRSKSDRMYANQKTENFWIEKFSNLAPPCFPEISCRPKWWQTSL